MGNYNKIKAFVACRGNDLFSGTNLETVLTVDYVDYLEVKLGYQLINIRQPKLFFDS